MRRIVLGLLALFMQHAMRGLNTGRKLTSLVLVSNQR